MIRLALDAVIFDFVVDSDLFAQGDNTREQAGAKLLALLGQKIGAILRKAIILLAEELIGDFVGEGVSQRDEMLRGNDTDDLTDGGGDFDRHHLRSPISSEAT